MYPLYIFSAGFLTVPQHADNDKNITTNATVRCGPIRRRSTSVLPTYSPSIISVKVPRCTIYGALN